MSNMNNQTEIPAEGKKNSDLTWTAQS